MNWKAFIISAITTAIISAILVVCLTGCTNVGFEKRATLMSDRVGIAAGACQYQAGDRYCLGFTVSAQWDLK